MAHAKRIELYKAPSEVHTSGHVFRSNISSTDPGSERTQIPNMCLISTKNSAHSRQTSVLTPRRARRPLPYLKCTAMINSFFVPIRWADLTCQNTQKLTSPG